MWGVFNYKFCFEFYDYFWVVLKFEGLDDYINVSYIKDWIIDGFFWYIVV